MLAFFVVANYVGMPSQVFWDTMDAQVGVAVNTFNEVFEAVVERS